jgi:hypothetical protein
MGGEVAKAIIGAPANSIADIYGVVLGDRIANWRLTNVIRAHAKVQAEAEKAGLKMLATKIPERFAYSWFEEVSRQDDDDLQTLFARLLARAADGRIGADERLVRMLSLMTPPDALVFQAFFERPPTPLRGPTNEIYQDRSRSIGLPRFKHAVEQLWPDQAGRSLEALENIGCLRRSIQIGKTGFAYTPRMTMDSTRGPDWDQLVRDRTEQRELLSATALGLLLAEATLDLPELSGNG